MKIGDYITAEDWNALGRDKQLALRDGLRFMGYRVYDAWFPDACVDYSFHIVLQSVGELVVFPKGFATAYGLQRNRISLEEVLAFIELTAFKV
mgnify:CR=1 FL=1